MTVERDHIPGDTGRQRQHPPPASTTIMPGESPTLAGHSDREKPLFEQDRHISEWVGTSTAITERQRLEDELRASEQRFRITFLRQAKDGCEELILLVNNVLDALAVTEEMQPPPSEELFVAPLVCDVLDHLDPRKEQADRLSLEIPEKLTVWANGQLLRQVIRNLLSNAFKYCPKPASVIISAALSDPAAQGNNQAPQVLISVQDTGPGIPPTELPLLFQKFVRLERDLSGAARLKRIRFGLFLRRFSHFQRMDSQNKVHLH